jgi:RNA polymerase sigma factor (sigma-70 family)
VDYIPDEILMDRVKEGNLNEMSVLFERYNKKIYNFFLRMGLGKDQSQDLTQNLFYRMIRYRHTYRSGNSVKSWIYQIARNLYNDWCRQEKKSTELFTQAEDYHQEVTEDYSSFSEDEFERLDRAIQNLSDSQKEIIVLSRFQGLKYEEISSITNQSVASIKVAMHRAIRQLRSVYFKQV